MCVCVCVCVRAGEGRGATITDRYVHQSVECQYKSQFLVAEGNCMTWYLKKVCGMKSHFLKENDVVLSSRWQFEDGRSKGMGTEWDQEVVGKVDPQKRVLCLAQGFLRG